MTEHRCKDGTWKPGKTRDCPICRPPRVRTHGIGGDLPGQRAGRGDRGHRLQKALSGT